MPFDLVYESPDSVNGRSATFSSLQLFFDAREEFFGGRGLASRQSQLQPQEQRLRRVEGHQFIHAPLRVNPVGQVDRPGEADLDAGRANDGAVWRRRVRKNGAVTKSNPK